MAWASQQAKEVWEPRIKEVNEAFRKLEVESVLHKQRSSALLFLSPEELPAKTQWALKHGCSIVVLNQEGVSNAGYSSQSSALVAGKAFQYRAVLTRTPEVWIDTLGDEDKVGAALGYPSCCTQFFKAAWVGEAWRDTTYPSSLPHGVQGPAWSNLLLRWLGVRFIRHLACGFQCPESIEIGKATYALGDALGMEQQMRWAVEMLSWPMQWSSLHGIAEIKTPVFKFSTNTDPVAKEVRLQRQAEGEFEYPAEGAVGLGFPFQQPSSLKATGTKSFAKAIQAMKRSDAPNTWTENGFSDEKGMEQAHGVLLTVLANIQSKPYHILDLGCGNGLLLQKVRDRLGGGTVHGVEINALSAAAAYNRFDSEMMIWHGNISDLHLWPREYDLTIFMPGRLAEMDDQNRSRVLNHLSQNSKMVLLYTYAFPTVELTSVLGSEFRTISSAAGGATRAILFGRSQR